MLRAWPAILFVSLFAAAVGSIGFLPPPAEPVLRISIDADGNTTFVQREEGRSNRELGAIDLERALLAELVIESPDLILQTLQDEEARAQEAFDDALDRGTAGITSVEIDAPADTPWVWISYFVLLDVLRERGMETVTFLIEGVPQATIQTFERPRLWTALNSSVHLMRGEDDESNPIDVLRNGPPDLPVVAPLNRMQRPDFRAPEARAALEGVLREDIELLGEDALIQVAVMLVPARVLPPPMPYQVVVDVLDVCARVTPRVRITNSVSSHTFRPAAPR